MIERFVEHSPITVMARMALQCALDPEWTDDLLEWGQAGNGEQIRESIFSVTVELMSMIASSPRDTARAATGGTQGLAVAITALHDRISRTRPGWAGVLVRDSVKRLSKLVQPAVSSQQAAARGYHVRIVDGSHLPKSEKCSPGPAGCVHTIVPQSGLRKGALTLGASVVYDPDISMIVDVVSCEYGQARDAVSIRALLEPVQPGELWIFDCNYSTRALIAGWQRSDSAFIVADDGCGVDYRELGRPVKKGRTEMGLVYEQAVSMTDGAGESPVLRCIELHQGRSGTGGDRIIRILTNVPASRLGAEEIASLSCRRWRETLSVPLDLMFNGDVLSSGRPRAVQLALGIAALAYNMLSTLENLVRCEQEMEARELKRLPRYIATSVRAAYAGMMIAVSAEFWQCYDHLGLADLGEILRKIARHVDPRSAHKQKREPAATPEAKAMLLSATLDVMFRRKDGAESDDGALFGQRFIAMATREFSSNPSKVLRDTAEAPVMVTKYGQAIAFLISVEDWNRMKAERRENVLDRLSAERA